MKNTFDENFYKKNRGWYKIAMSYYVVDFRGKYKKKIFNGKVIAESPIDAWNKACKEIYNKEGFLPQPPDKDSINFICSADINDLAKIKKMERFIIQESEKANHFVVTDQENKIVLIFKKGKFNETQEAIFLNDFLADDFMKVAKIMREIGEWVQKYHPDKLH